MPNKVRNLLLIPLACFSMCLVCACESQKSSVTGGPGQGGEKSSMNTPAVMAPGGSVQGTAAPVAREAAEKELEGALKNPPAIEKAQLKPEVINNVDSLRIVAEGRGGEGEVTFKYEWTKNGEPAGDTATLTGFKRGDKISVRVTPYDGNVYGQAKTVKTEIGNLPPRIIEHKDVLSAGKVFSYQVKATDPDGDTLTYSLKSAPQGMAIDSATGLIKWEIPGDFEGKAPVTVSVTDGHGGETFQSFTIDTKIEKKRPPTPSTP